MRQPDFTNMQKILNREKPNRPTLFEFIIDWPIVEKIIDRSLLVDNETVLGECRNYITAFHQLGYDYAVLPFWNMGIFNFENEGQDKKESISLNEGAVISDWDTFEKYPWPEVPQEKYDILDQLKPYIPEGMKLIMCSPSGILEILIKLVSYEQMCFMLIENPELVTEICSKIGDRLYQHYKYCLRYDTIGALILNDDWGFKTQTMISPFHLQEFIFPWYQKMVSMIHERQTPTILHSCGQMRDVWDDIINTMKFDGKHSYEDTIEPVEEAYQNREREIAVLGGIDVNYLCQSSPDEIYARCKKMLEISQDQGGYALGSGNSITSYIPVENYQALRKAALE